ncbi:hypothetical protein TNCV_2756391 [Trichonephila clavipes]|nr:hypothetical protein TNCV_2756391 [Trichonephila clavipes]
MTDKDIFHFVQSSKNIVDADSNDEKEMNNAGFVPTSSEMRNIMKNDKQVVGPLTSHRSIVKKNQCKCDWALTDERPLAFNNLSHFILRARKRQSIPHILYEFKVRKHLWPGNHLGILQGLLADACPVR